MFTLCQLLFYIIYTLTFQTALNPIVDLKITQTENGSANIWTQLVCMTFELHAKCILTAWLSNVFIRMMGKKTHMTIEFSMMD